MAQDGPMFRTANGIHNLVVSEQVTRNGQRQIVSMRENSWTYTLLASAVNIGIKILESPQGRRSLNRLGKAVVHGWHTETTFRFAGNVDHMATYVDHFLTALRQSFPKIIVADLGGPDTLAATQRLMPMAGVSWNGDLLDFVPDKAVGLYFNHGRVADMVAAADDMWRNESNLRARLNSDRMGKRYKGFQFMFGVATAHELCHAFVCYLSQNEDQLFGYTPPRVTYLDYHPAPQAPNPGQPVVRNGESGRWFENELFGGSVEFFRDRGDDHGQVGIPYIIRPDTNAFQVDPRFMRRMVESSSNFRFPFPVVGSGITQRQRAEQRMGSMGSTASGASLPVGFLYMQAMQIGPVLRYNVSEEELRRVARAPRPLRAQRVA